MSRTYSLNDYINLILNKICDNQTICKYLYYDHNNPLEQPNIDDTTVLYTDETNKRILFTPFVATTQDYEKSKLSILLDDVKQGQTNYFRNVNFDCIICCHNEVWDVDIDGSNIGLRPLLIWDELDYIFNRKTTAGVGDDNHSFGRLIFFNEYFSGYRIRYKSVSLPIRN